MAGPNIAGMSFLCGEVIVLYTRATGFVQRIALSVCSNSVVWVGYSIEILNAFTTGNPFWGTTWS